MFAFMRMLARLGIFLGFIGLFTCWMDLQTNPETANVCFIAGCISAAGIVSSFAMLGIFKEPGGKP